MNSAKEKGFQCSNCNQYVSVTSLMGTEHRNHCPFCLFSLHVDLDESGDRKAKCKALMDPIGLTFKQEGFDKYGQTRQGEIMLVHSCLGCDKIFINRIAGDDEARAILKVLEKSKNIQPAIRKRLNRSNIKLLESEADAKAVSAQLFGKDNKITQ